MLRRRLLFGRPLVRRPLLGAALVGGLGYVVGRRSSEPRTPITEWTDPADRLRELDRLHAAGTITDAEHAASHAALLRRL